MEQDLQLKSMTCLKLLFITVLIFLSGSQLYAEELDDVQENTELEQVNNLEGVSIQTTEGKLINVNVGIDKGALDYKLLAQLFGTAGPVLVCDFQGCDPLLGELFRILNIGISTIGVAFLGYIVSMAAFNTAASGQFFSQQFASAFIPLRTVLGISFLIPNQYGYSLLQQLVLYITLLGSNFGTIVWGKVVDYAELNGGLGYAQSSQIQGAVTYEDALEAASEACKTLVRMASIKLYYQNILDPNSSKQYGYSISEKSSKATLDLTYGGKVIGSANIEIRGEKRSENINFLLAQIANIESVLGSYVFDKETFNIDVISTAGYSLLTPPVREQLSYVVDATTNFFVYSGTMVTTSSTSIGKDPWVYIPNDFFRLIGLLDSLDATLSPAVFSFNIGTDFILNDVVKAAGTWSFVSDIQAIDNAVQAQFPSSLVLLQSQTNSPLGNSFDSNKYYKEYYNQFKSLFDRLQQADEQPLRAFLEYGVDQLGDLMVWVKTIFFIALIPITLSSISSMWQGSGNITIAFSVFSLLVAIFSLIIIKLPLILTFIFVLPMTPLVISSLAIISWFIQVFSSVIAAPIVALGLISPGAGLGNASPALVMLLNLFIRPALIVIGCIAGLLIFNVMAPLFTNMLLVVVGEFFHIDSFIALSFIPSTILLYLYLTSISALITRSFNLVFALPDQVLTWIGGHPMPFGRDGAQAMNQIKGAVTQGAAEIRQDMTKITTTASQQLRKIIDDKKDQEKNNNRNDDDGNDGNDGEDNAGEGNAGEGNAGEGNAGEGNAGEGNNGEGNNR